jgi:hypothetical protein
MLDQDQHILPGFITLHTREISIFSKSEIQSVTPLPGDPSDYLAIKSPDTDNLFTVTPTEASYKLNLVTSLGHGGANMESINFSI